MRPTTPNPLTSDSSIALPTPDGSSGPASSLTPASAPLTPLMTQYWEIKKQAPDCLLFFRMGDFYELFYDDAKVAAPLLEIALTSRNKSNPDPIAMCGVPHHSATAYMNKLVRLGHRVAVCDQLEDPTAAKGIVRRGITSIITPGTQLDPDALDATQPLLTHAIKLVRTTGQDEIHWASCDYSTGFTCFGTSGFSQWQEYVSTQNIQEILYFEDEKEILSPLFESLLRASHQNAPALRNLNGFYFDAITGQKRLKDQFEVHHLSALHEDLPALPAVAGALGALIRYFQDCRNNQPIPLTSCLLRWRSQDFLEMGSSTIEALELFSEQGLFHHLNHTKTAVGARLLRQRIQYPLVEKSAIESRLDDLEWFLGLDRNSTQASLREKLAEVFDFERILTRIKLKNCSPRELRNLATSLLNAKEIIQALKETSRSCASPQLEWLKNFEFAQELESLATKVAQGFQADLPVHAREGGIFQLGFDAGIDEYIELSQNGTKWLAEFEAAQRKATSISSLKVRFNRVFGYYIEITKTNLHLAPASYVRKQTTATGERFITDELKKFEDKILHAEKRRQELELKLFLELCENFSQAKRDILQTSLVIAQIDCLQSLGIASRPARPGASKTFVRPQIFESTILEINEGRHPILDLQENFIPNSLSLGGDARPFMLITGPNMGGKSTAMRQTALIVLLSQMGCFIPAASAKIGICDRIFTRIGANDRITQGMSTFMVEMTEMSAILNQASARSLILVDEIGRGTSTYDGLSLAWAIAECILNTLGARTLFATHYHELTDLAQNHPLAINMRVGVSVNDEDGHEKIQFLYRLENGAAQRSYGIYVAKLAGIPANVVTRAQELLNGFSEKSFAAQTSTHASVTLPPRFSEEENLAAPPNGSGHHAQHERLQLAKKSALKKRAARANGVGSTIQAGDADLKNQLQFGFRETSL